MSRRFAGYAGGAVATGHPGLTAAFSNVSGSRPSATWGTSITPGNNAYGSYTTLIAGASVTADVQAIRITFQAGTTSTAARDILAKIGIDTAGGTTFATLIPDLLASCSGGTLQGQTIRYYFPVRIPAGSTIGCAGSVNNATVGTFRCIIEAYATPVTTFDYGTAVEAVGTAVGTSSGVAVTPGTAAEGAWTELGTLVGSAWFFQVGIGINNAAMASVLYAADLAVSTDGGATKDIVIEDLLVTTSSAEVLWYANHEAGRLVRPIAAGSKVYGRLQCSGTADTGISMAAYALS